MAEEQVAVGPEPVEVGPAPVVVEPEAVTVEIDVTTTQERTEQQQQLALVIAELFGSAAEFRGAYCAVCANTTPHCRPRGKSPDYVKKVPWLCAPCLLPGGALNKIVRCLMIRQGEIAP